MKIDFPVPKQGMELAGLWQEAFGDSMEFIEGFFCTGYSPSRCRCLTVDNKIAAALYWFEVTYAGQRFAYLYAVATARAHRGKGLCRKLMADVHALLTKQGYDSVMLVPADAALREMYRKMGYEDCTAIGEIHCSAGASPAAIRNVDAEEYAALRRKLLPEKSVLQEGSNLTFLAAQTQLLAGEDFLLSAWLEDSTLHGTELLGNPDAAPGILRALGCEKGSFQIPGKDKPYAMLHKLHDRAVMPKYFGFSFD